jgi:large conductance mechanosensitive channel
LLAVVFALGAALLGVANSVSQAVVAVVVQLGEGREFTQLSFELFGATVYYELVLTATLALLLVGAALVGVVLLAMRTATRCPECLSDIPREASVCRYCTAELGPEPGDV